MKTSNQSKVKNVPKPSIIRTRRQAAAEANTKLQQKQPEVRIDMPEDVMDANQNNMQDHGGFEVDLERSESPGAEPPKLGDPRKKIVLKRSPAIRRLQGRENGEDQIRAVDPNVLSGPDWGCLSAERYGSGQFKGYRVRAKLEVPGAMQKEDQKEYEPFKSALTKVWGYANEQADKEMGLHPNYFLVRVESANLQTAIVRNFRGSFSEPFMDDYVNHFGHVDQSNRARGVPSVLEAPFTLDITSIQLTGRRKLGKNKQNPLEGNVAEK